MSNKRTRKKRFSTVICKTEFDGRILEVRGRLRLAAFLLLGFTLMIGWVLTIKDIPIPVRILAGFGGLFTAYGFFDTLFGKCYLKFDTLSREILLTRGNPLGQVHFKGSSADRISVSRVQAGNPSNSQVKLYTVVFTVKLDDAIVNFPLEVQSYSDEASRERIAHWEETLSIPPLV